MFQTSASGLLWEVQLHVEQSRLFSVGHLNDEMKRKRERSLYVKMNRRFRPNSSVHASLGLFHIDVTSLFMCFSLVCLSVCGSGCENSLVLLHSLWHHSSFLLVCKGSGTLGGKQVMVKIFFLCIHVVDGLRSFK